MKRASVVILNWNGEKLLEQFLPKVIEYTNPLLVDIVVADNGSTDRSLLFLKKNFPDVKIIPFDKNYGFAEGYNKAIQEIETEYSVLLNSDVEPTMGWIDTLIDYADNHPEIVALQPKLKDYNRKDYFEYAGACGGFLDCYGFPFCRGRIMDNVEKDEGQYENEIPILWATGACLFIRTKAYLSAGGLDASFFAHMEEIDLCWRLCSRGQKIVCLPKSVVYHVGGATLPQGNPQKVYLNYRNNLLMLYKNLSQSHLYKVITIRFFIDLVAILRFFLIGEWHSALSIFNAYKDFLSIKNRYKEKRQENLSLAVKGSEQLLSKHSILWEYFIKRKKTYSSLS